MGFCNVLRTEHLKRNPGIQETENDFFIERKKTFENIRVPTSFIVQLLLYAIWSWISSILMTITWFMDDIGSTFLPGLVLRSSLAHMNLTSSVQACKAQKM